ncbi:hypothetical protein FGO68_gene4886 [Halteria grandinella]|uniref:Uncharacterized protein n=1 Tax=Halteria grandinella TaxID=5974 RepID=A0A8J8NW59_HALGN|nr:hypothetical protein FGO68_gene4886 [Halteria grandinella]
MITRNIIVLYYKMKPIILLALATFLITLTTQQPDSRRLQMRSERSWPYLISYGFFRLMVFSDLLLNNNATENAATIQFMRDAIQYYQSPSAEGIISGVDLVVILGNAVNGTDWDGVDMSYFEDRWDMIMQVIIENQLKISFTLGDLDTKANLKDPKKIIRYLNSYGNLSMTYPTPTSIDGDSFYALPIKRALCPENNKFQQAAYLTFLDSNTYNDCPQKHSDQPENGCVSIQQINKAASIVNIIRKAKPTASNFFFSHQGFQEMATLWNDPSIDTVFSNNGGNQNVSCSPVDSKYIHDVFEKYYYNFGFIAGKDLDNRYIIKNQVNFTQIGRAGASNKSTAIKKRGAFIMELEEWADPKRAFDVCNYFNLIVTNQMFIEEGDLEPFMPNQVKASQRLRRSKIGPECNRYSDQGRRDERSDETQQQTEKNERQEFVFEKDLKEQIRAEERQADI